MEWANDKDAANKEYVDSNIGENAGLNKVSKSGDTMTCDLLFTIYDYDKNSRLIGCTDMPNGKKFSIALGNRRNRLEYENAALWEEQNPLTLKTTRGLLLRVKDN